MKSTLEKQKAACFVGKVADTAQQNGDVKEEEEKDVVIDMPPSLPKGYWLA